MSRSDYLMRIIQQFSKMLAALLTRTRSLDREPTHAELDELSRGFAGFDLDTLVALDVEQILQLYSVTGSLDVEKVYVAGVLLHHAARIDHDDRMDARALRLLEAVHDEFGDYLSREHADVVEVLRVRTAPVS